MQIMRTHIYNMRICADLCRLCMCWLYPHRHMRPFCMWTFQCGHFKFLICVKTLVQNFWRSVVKNSAQLFYNYMPNRQGKDYGSPPTLSGTLSAERWAWDWAWKRRGGSRPTWIRPAIFSCWILLPRCCLPAYRLSLAGVVVVPSPGGLTTAPSEHWGNTYNQEKQTQSFSFYSSHSSSVCTSAVR